jgi:hypothetical protein
LIERRWIDVGSGVVTGSFREVELMTHWNVFTIGSLVLSGFCLESQAYDIQYSWVGTIVPTSTADPWFIGAQGQPFSLDGRVSGGAPDIHNVDVQFAAFNLAHAHLVVGGQSASYQGGGAIDFSDNSAGTFDIIVLGGQFQRLGETVEVESAVALHPAAFEFTQTVESPPFFASTANVDRAACCGGTYILIVEAGSAVTVVPEPAPLIHYGVVLILAMRRRRYR